MKNYLFYDEVSGEEFLVETDMKEKAYLCAYIYFEEPKFVREVSHWEAEMMGLDTYQKGENKMNKNIQIAEEVKAYLLGKIIQYNCTDNEYNQIITYLRNWCDAEITFNKN